MIDEAMIAIEKVTPSLKGALPKDYGRPALNAVMLGELIDLISGIALGEGKDKARDLLGRIYEYFLGQFAGSEGKRGGEFYPPFRNMSGRSGSGSRSRAMSATSGCSILPSTASCGAVTW
jgi:hypothetical protein